MQIIWRLPGTFVRSSVGGGDPLPLASLVSLAVHNARSNYEGWIGALRGGYGLDMLATRQVEALLSQVAGPAEGGSPFLAESTGLLRRDRALAYVPPVDVGTFAYHFLPDGTDACLTLALGDARLPERWSLGGGTRGIFPIRLEEGTCPEFPELSVEGRWGDVTRALASLDGATWRRLLDTAMFPVELDLTEEIVALVDQFDAPPPVAFAHRLLNAPLEHAPELWTRAGQEPGWDQAWSSWLAGRLATDPDRGRMALMAAGEVDAVRARWAAAADLGPAVELRSGGWRSPLRRLLAEAERFVIVSTYVLEDEAMTEALIEAANRLPGRVWVILNLTDAFRDRWAAAGGQPGRPEDLGGADERKIACLRRLLASPALVRHGPVHLKAVATEREAWLGSINLTPGSLAFNMEATCRFRGGPAAAAALDLLMATWRDVGEASVSWPADEDLPVLRQGASIRPTAVPAPFLPPQAYAAFLARDLSRARTEVLALSYVVSSDSPLLAPLPAGVSRRVGAASGTSHPDLTIVEGCHAKVVVIDRRVVYVGGINDGGKEDGLWDLMVRIEVPRLAERLARSVRWILSQP